MKGIYVRSGLLFFCAVITSIVLVGCSQTDDVVSRVERSVLTLDAQNLPTPPAGLIYELWISKETVVDTAFDLSQATSLGRFSYVSNDSVRTFLDEAGTPRSAVFDLSSDFQTYRSVFVGLHRTDDDAGTRPGAIMLIAYIPGALDVPIRMVFPQHDSLWQSTCRFNLEGVTDRNRNLNDARGVWFSSYRWAVLNMPDTIGMEVTDSVSLDTIRPITIGNPPDTTNMDSLKAPYLYTVRNIRQETRRIIFPDDSMILIDSFMHTSMVYDRIYRADSTYPYTKRRLGLRFDAVPNSVTLDIFSQDDFGLPVVTEWGWKYAGWALTPHVAPSSKVGPLTPPAWPIKTYYRDWIQASAGGMIPTGTFGDVRARDDANPFALGSYLPPYPGEDFLNSTVLNDSLGVSSINLMPTTSGNVGSILVTLEPNNRLDTKTNFPLIAFLGSLPDRIDSVVMQSVGFNMMNATSLLGNQVNSFPIITVKIERY